MNSGFWWWIAYRTLIRIGTGSKGCANVATKKRASLSQLLLESQSGICTSFNKRNLDNQISKIRDFENLVRIPVYDLNSIKSFKYFASK